MPGEPEVGSKRKRLDPAETSHDPDIEAFKKCRVTEVTGGRDIMVDTRALDEVAESRVLPDSASVGDESEDSNQFWAEVPDRARGEDIDLAWQAAGSGKEMSFSVALPTDTAVKLIVF